MGDRPDHRGFDGAELKTSQGSIGRRFLPMASEATTRGSLMPYSAATIAQVILLAYGGVAVYNVFFHLLRAYPGPKLWAITRFPHTLMFVSGRAHLKICELHREYGPVVRVAPDGLIYNHQDAWKEVRGYRKNGYGEHEKDPVYQATNRKNMIGANKEDHSRFRRVLASAFSTQAMLNQQPIINSYVDKLFHKLHAGCAGGAQPLDIVSWYNYTTFDIVGDLAFGEPFGCLENSRYHPWVSLLFASIKNMALGSAAWRHPAIKTIMDRLLVPKEVEVKTAQHGEMSLQQVQKRLAAGADRPDFIEAMTKNKGGIQLSLEEITANAAVLITAGSETTATLLSAATYYLTTNPAVMQKLQEEVHSSFASETEIDLISVGKLKYMLAVLDESLRMFPPTPTGAPRKIAPGGDTIAEIWHYAVYHDPNNFAHPEEFIPERWLGDPRFANDNRETFQPFSYGPRNCIGRNLAYSEMRLILARMIWNFDLKLVDDSHGWEKKSDVYILWEKGRMNIYLTPRKVH